MLGVKWQSEFIHNVAQKYMYRPWLFILLCGLCPFPDLPQLQFLIIHFNLQIKEIKNWNQGRPGNEDIMDIANSKVVSLMYAFLSSIVQLGNGYNIILQTLCLSLSYINQTTTSIQHHLCSTYRALWELAAVCLSLVSGRVLAAQTWYTLYSRQLLSFCLCSISPHTISISLCF